MGMASLGAYVFCRRSDCEGLLEDIDLVLSAWADNVHQSRSRRHWAIGAADRVFDIDFYETARVLWDIEDELHESNLRPEDAPYAIGVSSHGKGTEVLRLITELLNELVSAVDGIATRPTT
jgi:hypothetical protein